MAERSSSRDPIYALHFSQAAAEASYLLRVTNEPLVAIRALATIEVEAKRVLSEMVDEARTSNYSWAQIAEALGVTRQAAQARFGGGTTGRPKRSRPSE